MIVTVAGTSGSGKSHLVRSFLDFAEKFAAVEDSRERGPYLKGYVCSFFPQRRPIRIIGRYDVPTGGCDTIHNVAEIYAAIRAAHNDDYDVLYEGLFMLNQTRGPQLAAEMGSDLTVLQLTTPLATCLASVDTRRAARGEGKLADVSNTKDNYRRATNYSAAMREAGARVIKVSREEALPKLLELFGVSK